jgi:molecular chaperone DnaJ
MSKDYYKTLGVDKKANQAEIKKAFYKLAHEYHPDKATGNADKFKEINEAYQVLGNEQKRQQYDQFGSAFQNGQAGGAGFGGFNTQGFNMDFDDLGDMFGGFGDMFGFGGRRTSRKTKQGHDIQTLLNIDFKEAAFGVDKEISLYKTVVCKHCAGQRAEPGTKIETCGTCRGTGHVARIQHTILGNIQTQTICPNCQGEGKIFSKRCSHCGGVGTAKDTVKMKIRIPAGIDDGEAIRLSGQGEAAPEGGVAGNLYIKKKINPDNYFNRVGYYVHTKASLSIKQAILGDKIDITTLEGELKLKIPAGIEPNTIIRLKGKGIEKLHGRGKGDQLIEVKIKIPKGLSRKQLKLLEDLDI